MLVAIGMTMVIATGGIDLSVGAVIAISAALATVLINPALGNSLITNDILTKDATNTPLPIIVLVCLAAGTLCGLWNGLLGFTGQNPTDDRHSDPDGRRPWHCPAHHQRADHDHLLHALLLVWQWVHPGAARFNLYCGHCPRCWPGWGCAERHLGCLSNPSASTTKSTYYSGISEKNVKLLVYTFSGFCGGVAGLILSSYVHSTDANNIGLGYELDAILAVVLGGTLMTGGRFSLLASAIGALVIWAFTISMYTFGVPAAALLAAKAVLVLVVILLYSDYTRRFMNRLFERKGSQHGATD